MAKQKISQDRACGKSQPQATRAEVVALTVSTSEYLTLMTLGRVYAFCVDMMSLAHSRSPAGILKAGHSHILTSLPLDLPRARHQFSPDNLARRRTYAS